MKVHTALIAALTLAFSASVLLAEQDNDQPKKGSPGGLGRPGAPGKSGGPGGPDITGLLKILPLMSALDVDRDGTISSSEIDNAATALKSLDKNSDGNLSAEELRPSMRELASLRGAGGGMLDMVRDKAGPMGLQMMSRMFQERDANGDGKLSGNEIPERMQPMLERVDTNGDGAIDKAELESAASRLGAQAGKGKNADQQGGAGVKPKRPE